MQIRQQRQAVMVLRLDHRFMLQRQQLGRGFAQGGANLGQQPRDGIFIRTHARARQRAQPQRQREGLRCRQAQRSRQSLRQVGVDAVILVVHRQQQKLIWPTLRRSDGGQQLDVLTQRGLVDV